MASATQRLCQRLMATCLHHGNIMDSLKWRVNPQSRIAMQFDKEIDTRGLNCPLPILRAKKALTELASGQVLKITATDPGSVRDFAAFAKQTGHNLVDSGEANKEFFYFLKKK